MEGMRTDARTGAPSLKLTAAAVLTLPVIGGACHALLVAPAMHGSEDEEFVAAFGGQLLFWVGFAVLVLVRMGSPWRRALGAAAVGWMVVAFLALCIYLVGLLIVCSGQARCFD